MEKSQCYLDDDVVLNNRYLIKKLIGETVFLYTYLAEDINSHVYVVIKELFPKGYMYRDSYSSLNLTVSEPEKIQEINNIYNSYLNEAKIQEKFSYLPGMVKLSDRFEQNNTLYIVMEYISGDELKTYIDRNGYLHEKEMTKIITMDQAKEIMEPIILTLAKMHESGVIHGNIKPREMLFSQSGILKLLGFQFDKMLLAETKKNTPVAFIDGFTPEEQYRKNGNIGPWTDVYSLCSTIYKCITGITPDDALKRVYLDNLKKPSELGIEINPVDEMALMTGLEVVANKRFANMKTLHRALYNRREEYRVYGYVDN